jgi:hypothetical protein
VRIDRRRQELAIVGVPVRRVDEEELLWRISIDIKGDEYRIRQDLQNLTLVRDGEVIAKGKVTQPISAELLIDHNGKLREVRGLEKTALSLQTLAASGMEEAARHSLTPASLTSLVASRYTVLFGETIGQPATPGTSWTIKNPPDSFVVSRTVTVMHYEPCGAATCARLDVDFQLDPHAVADAALDFAKAGIQATGGDPSSVSVRRATYSMSGTMLVEPATMLNHGASLIEGGLVTLLDPSQREVKVEVKGTTELTYAYPAAGRVSGLPGSPANEEPVPDHIEPFTIFGEQATR